MDPYFFPLVCGLADTTTNSIQYVGFSSVIPGYPRYTMFGDRRHGVYNLRIVNSSLEDDAEYQCQVGPAQMHKVIRANASLTVICNRDRPTSGQRPLYPPPTPICAELSVANPYRRLNKRAFRKLCKDLEAHVRLKGSTEIPLELKVLCALSFLATRLPLSRRGSLKRGRSGEAADWGVAGDPNRGPRLIDGKILFILNIYV
ncbi:hypothetical protein SFRURICE_019589 [Spodoptera frugiperda]|nr:hypothetical protein SFRURICE_019589 [Spodoptera frugiperda]